MGAAPVEITVGGGLEMNVQDTGEAVKLQKHEYYISVTYPQPLAKKKSPESH